MPNTIGHKTLLQNIRDYLALHARNEPINLKGICNGASLLLLTYIYEAMNNCYNEKSTLDSNTLFPYIEKATNDFFDRLKKISNLPSTPEETEFLLNELTTARKSKKWFDANAKLQTAINNRKINLTNINKKEPYYHELCRLAYEQQILTEDEKTLLKDTYVGEIPEFESFINDVALFQDSSKFIYDAAQTDYPKMFPLLQYNDKIKIPTPKQEEGAAFVLTPVELATHSSTLLPDSRPILLHLPEHATFAMRIGNHYLFYDINHNEISAFTDKPEIMACLFSKHNIQLEIDALPKNIHSFEKMFELKQQIDQIDKLQSKLENENNREKRILLIKDNQAPLSPMIGFSLSIYSHPNQFHFDNKWLQSVSQIQTDLKRKDSKGENVFWKACYGSHYAFAKQLFEKGVDIHTKRNDGTTAFYVACQNNNINILELFIPHGYDVNAINDNGRTALYTTAISGNYPAAKWLLEHKANPNLGVESEDSSTIITPFVIACAKGHADIVQLLLTHNATKDNNALFQAAQYGHTNVVNVLLKNGFNVNTTNEAGITALMMAASEGHIEVMRLLLDKEAKIDAVIQSGATALLAAVENGQTEAMIFLHERGADINTMSEGTNALHCACEKGHAAITEYLLKHDFDPNKPDGQGLTPLMLASYCGNIDVINVLLNSPNIDINTVSNNLKTTALHLAIQEDKTDVVLALCRAGANVNLKNAANQTPLDMAIENGDAKTALLLLQYGAVCQSQPKPYELPDISKMKTLPRIIKLKLSTEQEFLNNFINRFPVIFTQGNTLAEKIGLLFKEITVKPGMKLFESKTPSIVKEARLIANTLLNPDNKDWDRKKIIDFLKENKPSKENQDNEFKFARMFAKAFLQINQQYRPENDKSSISPVKKV